MSSAEPRRIADRRVLLLTNAGQRSGRIALASRQAGAPLDDICAMGRASGRRALGASTAPGPARPGATDA